MRLLWKRRRIWVSSMVEEVSRYSRSQRRPRGTKTQTHRVLSGRGSFCCKNFQCSIFERFLRSSRMSFSYTHWRIAKQQIHDYVRRRFYCSGGFHLGSI